MSLLWINGILTDKADARVSPFDHGFLYGDGVWEPLRVFAGQLFRPLEHVESLFAAAGGLGIEVPLAQAQLVDAIETTVRANARTEGYVRVIVTRGPGTLGPDPRKIDPQILIIVEEYHPFPIELYGHGLHVAVFPTPLDSHHPSFQWRTLGQPHVTLAKQYALRQGRLEALLVDHAGHLIGSTEGMLFLVKDGAVVVAGGPRRDVTGYAVAALAGEGGLIVVEHTIALPDVLAAEEAFQVGTACGVIGIVQVDGKDVGTGTEGPVTRSIREAFRRLTHSVEAGV